MRRAGMAAAIALAFGCTMTAAQTGADGQTGGTQPGSGAQTGGSTQGTGSTQGSGGEGNGVQQGTRGQTGTQSTTGQSQTVSVIGCVQSADAGGLTGSAPGNSGAQTQTGVGAAGRFILTNARMGTVGPSRSGSEAAGTSGSSGNGSTTGGGATSGRASASGGSTYRLEGSDLAQHIGHQVEVTGTMMASAGGNGSATERGSAGNAAGTSGKGSGGAATGGGSTDAAGGSSTGATGASRSTGGAPTAGNDTRLRVTSVRTLSNNCSTQ